MKSYIDCVHCYLKQCVSCMELAGVGEDRMFEIMNELLDYVKSFNREDSPACNSSRAILKTYELTGAEDPYRTAKKESNDLALGLYGRLKEIILKSGDGLYTALKISVAGNVIDLGINRNYDVESSLRHSLETGFTLDHYQKFLTKLQQSDAIVILGDNAGEIVFDRLLVEELKTRGREVIYIVKSGPVLNDSTIEDSVYTGMDKVARVLANGMNYLGTYIDGVTSEVREILKNSQVIIAKGQANFESLEAEKWAQNRVFFLLKAKCENVAKAIGVNFGDVVFFARNGNNK